MKTTRKIGILLILFFSITLFLCVWKNDTVNETVFWISIMLSAVLLPFGLSLIAFNNKTNTVKNIYLTISLVIVSMSVFSRIQHLPGAGIELVVGILLFCFAYSPIQLKDKYLKWLPYSKSKLESFLLSAIDYLGITFFSMGIMFKIQWWPYANVLLIVGFILLIIGIFLWNYTFKKEVKRRKIAEEKIKEQIHEINDSIKYAKRIQSAILPPLKSIQKELPQSFVLYVPKDVVAGDFYWFAQHENSCIIAAADCTGHGVPGAMVSVICNYSLNRCFREYGLTNPSEILNKAREIVIEEFEKSEEEVKDGMDISIASLEKFKKTETEESFYELHWSGANNPLWVIRKNGVEIEEYKGDKQPIGKHSSPKPFTNHSVKLSEGDAFYLFTDGYADQFGGPKGKKFMYKAFKELLLSIQNMSMNEQKDFLEKSLLNWRDGLEQVDDICIIGVKLH